MRDLTDDDRVALSASWAAQAYGWLADEPNAGRVMAMTDDAKLELDTLCDGLRVLSDNLSVVSYPFPPPTVQGRYLRVVK